MIGWPYVGSERAHTKYSVAEDISVADVDDLEIVWQWEPNEMPLEEYDTRPGPFQATPIMAGNILYLSSMYTHVSALDAATVCGHRPVTYRNPPIGMAIRIPSTNSTTSCMVRPLVW